MELSNSEQQFFIFLRSQISDLLLLIFSTRYAVAFVRHLTPIPAGLPLDQAAPILCAGVTVWKAIKQSNTKPGDFILIAGAGGT